MKTLYNWVKSSIIELWAKVNKFLKETGRNFLEKKIIDNLLVYLIYILLILTICFAASQLIPELVKHFLNKQNNVDFPFILEFAELLFLYFLPIFILFGFLNFYNLEWKRQINKSNKPNPIAQKNLTLSKKLFFSSVLSYLSLKIVDILFFNFEKVKNNYEQLVAIGIFFILLTVLVITLSINNKENESH